MTVRVRDYAGGRKEVDIRFRLPNGEFVRKRFVSPVDSESGARRWGEAKERDLYQKSLGSGGTTVASQAPTFERFAPRFIEEYAKANQHKPSGVASKESVLTLHLLPRIGSKRLNEVTDVDVQRLKADLAEKKLSPKTVNNVLSVLATMLKVATKWKEIHEAPVRIELLKTQDREMTFYEPDDYEKLLRASSKFGHDHELLVRLGGDLGLRRGEMIAISGNNLDFERQVVSIDGNVVAGTEVDTKGMTVRRIPWTPGLTVLLQREFRGTKGRLLTQADGQETSAKILRVRMAKIQKAAGLRDNGGLHILRHTFCSHLAMAGVPVLEIQQLAGHAHLSTTLGYMHLAPNANQAVAISKLDEMRRLKAATSDVERKPGADG
jgi:integrase